MSYFDGCSPARGQPAISSPAVTVGFPLFPLQCRINVLSSLCGVLNFPQNGLFLQNSPGAQTILFWWARHILFMVITLTSLISDEISCAYFVLFMSLILLLVFPPFFPVACLFIWKTFILHHFKNKRWNTGARILSNLAEYTVGLSNFWSRAYLGFVSQFKRAVAHLAANVKNAPGQLEVIRGTEKSILKKKKKPGGCDDRSDSRLPWQRGDARDPLVCMKKSALHGNREVAGGECGRSPAPSGDTPSRSPPHHPGQSPSSVRGRKLQPPKHLYGRLARQQAFTNKSKDAVNTCNFSGVCIVNTKMLKASQLSSAGHWHPAQGWLWCLTRSSLVGP